VNLVEKFDSFLKEKLGPKYTSAAAEVYHYHYLGQILDQYRVKKSTDQDVNWDIPDRHISPRQYVCGWRCGGKYAYILDMVLADKHRRVI